MWENSPLAKGWEVVRRYPAAIWLIPAVWDLGKWGIVALLFRLPFSRWDFTLGFALAGRSDGWHLRVSLPPAMPTVEQLGLSYSLPPPAMAEPVSLLAMCTLLVCDCLIRAGYLNLVNAAIHGVGPTAASFARGIFRFGPRLTLLVLLWMGWTGLTEWLADRGTLPHAVLPTLNLIVLLILMMAEFVTVTDDVLPPLALVGGPILTYSGLGNILGIVGLCGLFSMGLTGVASATGLLYPWLLAPVWAFLGTWLTAGTLAAYQVDISTRSDPTASVSWACPACQVHNHPLASTCVACGHMEPKRQSMRDPTTPSAPG